VGEAAAALQAHARFTEGLTECSERSGLGRQANLQSRAVVASDRVMPGPLRPRWG